MIHKRFPSSKIINVSQFCNESFFYRLLEELYKLLASVTHSLPRFEFRRLIEHGKVIFIVNILKLMNHDIHNDG